MEFLLNAVKDKAKSGWLRAIDGRRLRVRSQHAALNTLLQGMGAIVMKVALFEAHDRLSKAFTYREDFAYLLNIHDEIQVECKPEIAEKVGQIMADCVAVAGQTLKSNCPLSGSFDIGDNWSETH
jgi:DNA polymerase-1